MLPSLESEPSKRFLVLWAGAGENKAELACGARDGAPRPFLATPHLEAEASFAPDGSRIAYQADPDGSWELYVRPYPGPGPQTRVSTEGGVGPRWTRRGEALLYLCPDRGSGAPRICGAEATGGGEDGFRPPRPLLELDPRLARPLGDPAFTLSLDGEFFYLVRQPPEAVSDHRIVYVPGWTEELAAGSGGE